MSSEAARLAQPGAVLAGRFAAVLVEKSRKISRVLEADAMRDFLVASGITADAITVEPTSGSTHENALRTADLLRRDVAPINSVRTAESPRL